MMVVILILLIVGAGALFIGLIYNKQFMLLGIVFALIVVSFCLAILTIFYGNQIFYEGIALDRSIGYFGALGLPSILFYWEWRRNKEKQDLDDNLLIKEFLQFIRDTYPINPDHYNHINGLFENQFYDDPLDENHVYFHNIEKECENLLYNISKKSKFILSIKKLQSYSQTMCDMLKFYWEHTDKSLHVITIRYQRDSKSIPLWDKINTIDLSDILVTWSEFIQIITLDKFQKLDKMTLDRDDNRTFIDSMDNSIHYQNKSFDKIKYYVECYDKLNCYDKDHIFIHEFNNLMDFIKTQYGEHNLDPVSDVPEFWQKHLTDMFQSVVCSLGNTCKKDSSLKITPQDVFNALKEYVKNHHTIFKIDSIIFEDEKDNS